ncbi:MAG TPA: type II secretion system protein GspM [Casimicrobiaceae bacterium]|nr:type II secretion system protein GspM [Casimicrobiaceae bacterium]
MIERARDAWVRWSPRERALVALGAIVVVLGAGWPLLWQPIERDLERSSRELATLHAHMRSMNEAASEIPQLIRNAKPPRTADAKAAIESTLKARGLAASVSAIDATSDGRVRLTFASVELPALAALLDALGRDEQLFTREATLAARVEPGQLRAEVTLAR